jgi:hypothetical protein
MSSEEELKYLFKPISHPKIETLVHSQDVPRFEPSVRESLFCRRFVGNIAPASLINSSVTGLRNIEIILRKLSHHYCRSADP